MAQGCPLPRDQGTVHPQFEHPGRPGLRGAVELPRGGEHHEFEHPCVGAEHQPHPRRHHRASEDRWILVLLLGPRRKSARHHSHRCRLQVQRTPDLDRPVHQRIVPHRHCHRSSALPVRPGRCSTGTNGLLPDPTYGGRSCGGRCVGGTSGPGIQRGFSGPPPRSRARRSARRRAAGRGPGRRWPGSGSGVGPGRARRAG